MRTLGVDLASQPDRTAMCIVDWHPGEAVVTTLQLRATDDAILGAHAQADVTGIDCPLGWPDAFGGLVAGEIPDETWTDDFRDRLRFRLTDQYVRKIIGRWPLSVSSDLIAVPAMRGQGLLRRMGTTDRSGDGRVFEVYPAASLAIWGFPSRGYKGRAGAEALCDLVRAVRRRSTPWLCCKEPQWETFETHDDAFDALIAALTARAAAIGLTDRPSPRDQPIATREGWIALPRQASLDRLVSPQQPG